MLFLSFAFFVISPQFLFASDAHKKSLFVENITPFITWPANTREDFRICVLQDKAVLDALRSVCTGKSIAHKPVQIKDLVDTDTASQCDLLFIGKQTPSTVELTQALANIPTLTISDITSLKDKGVMITIFEIDDRIACAINQRAARQADIHVSYLLLESAHEVIK